MKTTATMKSKRVEDAIAEMSGVRVCARPGCFRQLTTHQGRRTTAGDRELHTCFGVACVEWATTQDRGAIVVSDFDPVADVEEFHRKFGVMYDGPPRLLDDELSDFRRKFLREELKEYEDAVVLARYDLVERPEKVAEHLEQMLDAMVDLVYVAIGTAQYHGLDFREAWRRVHEANMRKMRAERASDSKRGTTYDVVKPPGWQAPSHADLVENHAHRRDK